MGWITRRIVGYIVFAIVSSILGAYAVSQGYMTGEPTLTTACGAIILGVAFLISFAVTTRMKEDDVTRKKRAEMARRWQEYYARVARKRQEDLARRWQEYYARLAERTRRPP